MTRYSAVLFDLDGTIVDSAPGITAALDYTFRQMGVRVPSPDRMLEWVGPPIMDSFRNLAGLDHAKSLQALAIYREYYLAHGIADAHPYPGLPQLIRDLASARVPTSLATSKPEAPSRAILDRLDLTGFFTEITGASEDETRSAKADVVAEALRRLAADGADVSRTVMIGDRRSDVEGAAENDVPTIFVRWGYGSLAESAGAVATVSDAAALRRALGFPPASAT